MQFHWVFFVAMHLQPMQSFYPEKLSPGCSGYLHYYLSINTFVPPVTEDLSPPASRITGADSPVMAHSSIVAMPSTISPSIGIISPASQKNNLLFAIAKRGQLLFHSHTFPHMKYLFAGVSSLVLRKLSACALPLASAIASAKLANSTVINRITNTMML